MKVLKNNLLAVAFVAAALTAFAFKAQEPDPNLKLFGQLADGNWQEVTSPGHLCDPGGDICVAQFENDDTMTPPVYSEPGRFVP